MLTASEREWLELKQVKYKPWCIYAGWCHLTCHAKPSFCPTQPTKQNYIEAAEFSERVTAKLAENTDISIKALCQAGAHGQSIAWANLKIARLQVEEEMNADGQ